MDLLSIVLILVPASGASTATALTSLSEPIGQKTRNRPDYFGVFVTIENENALAGM